MSTKGNYQCPYSSTNTTHTPDYLHYRSVGRSLRPAKNPPIFNHYLVNQHLRMESVASLQSAVLLRFSARLFVVDLEATYALALTLAVALTRSQSLHLAELFLSLEIRRTWHGSWP